MSGQAALPKEERTIPSGSAQGDGERATKRAPRRRRTARTARASRTLTEWLPYWELELGARNVRRATVDNQRKVLAKLVRFAGDVAAECVTSDVLSAWRDHMHEAEKLKPTSTNRYLLTAGTFFNWLRQSESYRRHRPLHCCACVTLTRLPCSTPTCCDG